MATELLRRLTLAVLAYAGAWYMAAMLAPLWEAATLPMRVVLGQ